MKSLAGSAQQTAAGSMNVFAAAQWYVQTKILGSIQGMKALLLDDCTATIAGLVCSQSRALELQVYCVDRLKNESRRPMGGFRAVCLLRPTGESVRALRDELAAPTFDEYHVFFTSTLPDHLLKDLAQADKKQRVHQVQEVFLDFSPLSEELFSLDLQSCMPLEPPRWDQPLFDQLCGGLASVLLALKEAPGIAYQRNSPVARKVAEEVEDRIARGNHTSDSDLFRFGKSVQQPAFLLILDRRDDPVTPLLNQWTYTAMVHEALGIRANRVDMLSVGGGSAGAGDQEEVVLSRQDDEFYARAEHMLFGEIGEALKEVVDELQRQQGGGVAGKAGAQSKLTSIGDIQRFMDRYPELRRQERAVAKHVALTSELSKMVEKRGLLDQSELEQELACTEGLTEAFNRVETLVEDRGVEWLEKVRLVLLYSLRYELEGERETRFLERSLCDCWEKLERDAGGEHLRGGSWARTVQLLRKHAGVQVRSADIFNKKTVVGAAKGLVKKGLEGIHGVANVLTRHEPLLASRLAALRAGGVAALRDAEITTISGARVNPSALRPSKVIVFILGGATYAEARIISEFNAQNVGKMRAILGSNTVLRSADFLDDVLRLEQAS